MANKVFNFTSNSAVLDKLAYKDISIVAEEKNSLLQDQSIKLKNFKLKNLVDVDAVKNSVHNIFTWIKGERILDPEFGTDLRKYLYEPITEKNAEQIIAEIKTAILKFDPRVEVDDVSNIGTISNNENNEIPIQITYHIVGLPNEKYYFIVV